MKKFFTFCIATIVLLFFSIPLHSSAKIKQVSKEKVVKYYTNKICKFRDIRRKRCNSYANNIYDESKSGPLGHWVLFSILWQESTYRNVVGDRYSKHRAFGLGQIQERTAEQILGRQLNPNYGPDGEHELIIRYRLNIELTYRNIIRHYRHHNNNLNLALRAYNGGRGNIHYRDTKVYASEVEEKIDYITQELEELIYKDRP